MSMAAGAGVAAEAAEEAFRQPPLPLLPPLQPLPPQEKGGRRSLVGRHRPPSHWLPGARGFTPTVLLPSAAAWTDAPAVGLLGAPASIPRRQGLCRKVHQCERCDSDRVADRPFALRAEALDRRGRGTRLASPVRAGVATRIAGRPKPLIASAPSPESPLGLATQGVVKTASPDPSLAQRAGKSRDRPRARKRRCSFGLRDFVWVRCGRLSAIGAGACAACPRRVELWSGELHTGR